MDKIDPPTLRQKRSMWVSVRVGVHIVALLLLLALVAFGLDVLFDMSGKVATITLSLLVGLPFSLGAVAALLNNPTGALPRFSSAALAVSYVMFVLIAGGLILQEGIICIVILLPLWFGSAAWGASIVAGLHEKFRQRSRLNCSLIICLPLVLLLGETYLPPQADQFTVQRSITINAPVNVVWSALTDLSDIEETEGGWNITQSVFGVPRPRSAHVEGQGVGAIRQARWGDNISFEEHIHIWEPERAMRWSFVFPNASVHQYTDRHISPDGQHLKIQDGGYALRAISPSQTLLVLDTKYTAITPVNLYSAIWGELFLGDIQANVLSIVKARAETQK